MLVKYIERDIDAELEGMLEIGNFYEVMGATASTFFINDECDEKVEISMIKMGIVPNNSKVKLNNDLLSYKKGTKGYVISNIEYLINCNIKEMMSPSYMFCPYENTETMILCERNDFTILSVPV